MIRRINILTIVVFASLACTPAGKAQIERYERKSVSLFRLEAVSGMNRDQARMVFGALQNKLKDMGRFDINPIPLRPGISLERVFEIAKEYVESQQLERARAQFELMDEHYKEERITGETLDQIIAGAYVIVPRIEGFSASADYAKKTDKEGEEYWEVKAKAKYSLKIEVWNAENQGSFENPVWEPLLEDEAAISTAGSASKEFSSKGKAKAAVEELTDKAVENSLFLLKLQLGKTLKSFEMFTIKAKVTERDLGKDLIRFDFGDDAGLHKDDPFKVVYYEKNAEGKRKKIDLAYVKVRETTARESRAQALIVYNPERLKENELINVGDQVIEYPRLGLNFAFKSGYVPYSLSAANDTAWMYYYDGWDHYYFHSDQTEIKGAPALMFNMELNLGQFGFASETYLTAEGTMLLNYPLFGGLGELGYKKRFYKRRLAFTAGFDLGALYIKGKIGEVPVGDSTHVDYMYQKPGDITSAKIPAGAAVYLEGYSIGANLKAGWEYLISPEVSLTFEGGYRFYLPVEGDRWTITAEDEGESWELDINDFTGEPEAAKISGAWFSAGILLTL